MKTSNIIITSIVLIIFISLSVLFFSGKAKINQLKSQIENGEIPDSMLRTIPTNENIYLEKYTYVAIKGVGSVDIFPNDTSNYISAEHGKPVYTINGDTLTIELSDIYTELHSPKLLGIIAGEKTEASITHWEGESIQIKAKENGKIYVNSLQSPQLYIHSVGNSEISIAETREASQTAAEIHLDNNAEVNIDKLFDMQLKTDKRGNSSLYDN